MNMPIWLEVARGVTVIAGLILIGRLVTASAAYRSWRTFAFLIVSLAAFLVAALLRAVDGLWPAADLSLTFYIADLAVALGLIGTLYEVVVSDRLRFTDLQRLMDQWRRASSVAEKRTREREILADITRELTASLNLQEVLQAVVDRALALSGADAATIFLLHRETRQLVDYHVGAQTTETLRHLPPPRTDGLTSTVARTGEPAFISDTHDNTVYADGAYPTLRAIASLPLRLEGEVVGVLNLLYAQPRRFDDETTRLLGSLSDVAALAVRNADLHERMRALAVTDELTGLANRRRFLELLRAELQRARRYERPLSLLMVDLDRLKQINDENGHAAGDAMLRGVAQALRDHVRNTDLPARLGGDEFAVLLPETSGDTAAGIAERIRDAVEMYQTTVEDMPVRSTVSIGVISREAGNLQDLPTFIHLADEALYKSKTLGRNRVTVWDLPVVGREPAPGAALKTDE